MTRLRKTKASASTPSRAQQSLRFAPNPLPSLTPQNLAAYLDSFHRGYLRDTAILWDAIIWRDDRVGADAAKRHKTLARYGYTIVPAEGQNPKASAVKRQSDAVKFALDNLTARDALDTSVRGGIDMCAKQMMRAVGMQWQVHELVWKSLDHGISLDAIATPLWWFERTTGALRYLPSDLAYEGVDLDEDGWLITRGDGIMGATSVLYLLKRMSLLDWTLYNGRVGPGIHATTPAQPNSTDWTNLEEAASNFSFDLTLVTGDGVKITPIEMSLRGELPWPKLYEAMTKAITVLWRGGNLLSDSGGQPDQTGVTIQGAESDVLKQDDARMLSDALNDYIVMPLLKYRFNEDPLVWVEWQSGGLPDINASIKIDSFLSEQGWQFTQEDLGERYGRTPPQAGQTVLTPRPEAPAIGLPPVVAANSLRTDAEDVHRQLVAASVAELGAAQQQDLAEITERLRAILTLSNGTELIADLAQFRADLPALAARLLAVPAAAHVLENALAAGLINGWAEGTVVRTEIEGGVN